LKIFIREVTLIRDQGWGIRPLVFVKVVENTLSARRTLNEDLFWVTHVFEFRLKKLV